MKTDLVKVNFEKFKLAYENFLKKLEIALGICFFILVFIGISDHIDRKFSYKCNSTFIEEVGPCDSDANCLIITSNGNRGFAKFARKYDIIKECRNKLNELKIETKFRD
jgi:hypothetical protein